MRAGIDGRQLVIAQAIAGHDAGREVLEHHISAFDQLFDQGLALGRLHIHPQALFAPVMHDEVARRGAVLAVLGHDADMAAVLAPGRQLDLDDLGAQIDHQPGGLRTGQPLGKIEHPDTFENLLLACHASSPTDQKLFQKLLPAMNPPSIG